MYFIHIILFFYFLGKKSIIFLLGWGWDWDWGQAMILPQANHVHPLTYLDHN